MNTKLRPPTPEQVARMKQMAADGYSLTEIRRTVKTSVPRIKEYTGYQGLTPLEGASLGAAARVASLKLRSMGHGYYAGSV